MNIEQNAFFVARRKQLESNLLAHRTEYTQLPKGTLVLNNSRKAPQWFCQKKNKDGYYTRQYLGKKKLDQAIKLARKAFLQALIKDEENELKCINAYLDSRHQEVFGKFYDKESPYHQLLFNTSWENEPYDKSQKKPEKLKIHTIKGDLVRSKSEALIANTLFELGIPYRYEWNRLVGGIPIAADFTIINPRNQKLIIWEHFGRMGEEGYYSDWQWKMDTFVKNGYLPGVNMITTYENLDYPLEIQEVYATIQHYLL